MNEERSCAHCGEEFVSKQPLHRFCCRECAQANEARDRYRVFDRDDFTCIYCGRSSIEDGVRLHCDHIVPQDVGGTDVFGNLVTACRQCNLSKHSSMPGAVDRLLAEVTRRNKAKGILGTQRAKKVG